MSLEQDSVTPEALDAAIRMLYRSRPAKAAALLGLIDTSGGSALEPKVAAYSVNSPYASATGFFTPPAHQGTLGGVGTDSLAIKDKAYTAGDESTNHLSKGPKQVDKPTGELSKNIAIGTGIEKVNSLRKQAMTEAEFNAYYGGAGNLMEATGDPSLTPTQMATLGIGGVGITGANRMRAKNVAGRDLRNIRKQYLQAVQEGALDKQQLKHLNRELKLRGAKPTLSLAPTVGIADAQMAKAEQGLTSQVLKKRYKGAIPLLAASLLGTLAYNQLS
jgi:hypothetical protein